MSNFRSRVTRIIMLTALLVIACPLFAFAEEAAEEPALYATAWAIVPPVAAILLALITKEVYSSLFIGIVIGGALYAGNFEGTLTHVISDGIVGSLADSYNVGILVFLVILGVVVALLNKSGGSKAFGVWASEHIKTKAGVQFATIVLGILIFVDDYFNCLTVGSVMSPLAEEKGISRTKLAYLIDATAAPICIIAPISSWAAAVTGFVEGENGFTLFIQAIPYNFYALLTIAMMFLIVGMKFDYGKMREYADKIQESKADDTQDLAAEKAEGRRAGKVIDLVLPIIILIICCVLGMIYTGGFFSGTGFVEAFSGSDASVGLSLGSVVALIIIVIVYVARGVLGFKESMDCIPEGFKAMVAPILILTLAWTLKAMTDSLGLATFVSTATESVAGTFMSLLPAIIFAIGCGLAFASGTSWGTFGILIPIVVEVFQGSDPQLMIISIAACMAGAVCGDHCSPISDTTIMSSAGARCNHVAHVTTQLPYAITVAAISFVTYIIAGFTRSAWISLPVGLVILIAVLVIIKKTQKPLKSEAAKA
ncbi:MAG: Na+/H+ antiporter NhaC family protein [Eubacteriales bacterium]|nr:Na+/H+ antiporter NhaC family protein [Eubacteriaceae bacterium]MDD6478034.1 Na+/H+ antiporter NhaC family protein [Eubacteriales bacterium]MDY3037000.1 Na+/H+ antiporter NhaC family protein [Eubacteriales bacterium]